MVSDGPDGIPGTPDDEFGNAGWVMSTNPAELPNGLAPIAVDQYFSDRVPEFPQVGSYVLGTAGPTGPTGPTDPGTGGGAGMTWKVYQVSSQADLDLIKDPGHIEPNGFGPFPIQIALFQDGPMWRIQKVSMVSDGPDGIPGTPDDEFGNAGWVMSTHPAEIPDGLAPIAVDQYFSDRFAQFPHIGSYVLGTQGPIGPIGPTDPGAGGGAGRSSKA